MNNLPPFDSALLVNKLFAFHWCTKNSE